jgi:hypothetical protein
VSWLYPYLLAAIVLDHAHLASPMGLAWSNTRMRRTMLAEWKRFIVLPVGCLAAAVIVGLLSSTTRQPAFLALAAAYFVWNLWHFGSQHFGVASLLGWRSGPRWFRQALTIGTTVLVLVLPVFLHVVLLVLLDALINLAHWLTDISLSARKKARHWALFLSVVLLIGMSGFLWKTISIDPRYCGLLPACTASYAFPVLLGLRYGLGFVHFLYSRWVWQGRYMRVMGQAL